MKKRIWTTNSVTWTRGINWGGDMVREYVDAVGKTHGYLLVYVCIDFFLVVIVVTQRVEDLRHGQVREAIGNLFRGDTESVDLHNGPHRCSR